MCIFGGSPKAPDMPAPPPTPAPLPAPVPADTNPIKTADSQRKKLDALKYGALSTIKTSSQGTTGAGPDLSSTAASGMYPSQKKNLGN